MGNPGIRTETSPKVGNSKRSPFVPQRLTKMSISKIEELGQKNSRPGSKQTFKTKRTQTTKDRRSLLKTIEKGHSVIMTQPDLDNKTKDSNNRTTGTELNSGISLATTAEHSKTVKTSKKQSPFKTDDKIIKEQKKNDQECISMFSNAIQSIRQTKGQVLIKGKKGAKQANFSNEPSPRTTQEVTFKNHDLIKQFYNS